MWNDFVEAFGWRFHGVVGYQSAQMWVEEMKTWVEFQEAQHSVQRIGLRVWLAVSVSINIGLLIVLAFEIANR